MTSDNTCIIGCFQLKNENPMCEHPAQQIKESRMGVLCAPDSSKGDVKIIFLPVIAFLFLLFCLKLEHFVQTERAVFLTSWQYFLFLKRSAKYLKIPFYVLESFQITMKHESIWPQSITRKQRARSVLIRLDFLLHKAD